ncbi:hypothetical protein JHK82_036803 [Glycine max]|nr:hypothetical protein JHK85_037554 [Glycine max]KAG4977532.1 hypothetical protein JHK86_037006 [Glycine max]KAG5113534.1 hypothetical protein JHK82_036803 [Glycine max]
MNMNLNMAVWLEGPDMHMHASVSRLGLGLIVEIKYISLKSKHAENVYPVDFQVKEPEELVTKRCIDGALSILKTWLNSKTVKRVVYTTSVGAVICNGKEDQVMDESFWSDVVYLRSSEILK